MAATWDELSGTFHRILFEADQHLALVGVRRPVGRFHHDGQAALYLSPKPEWAAKAIDVYRLPGDPRRVSVQLRIAHARVVDLRKADHCAALSIRASDAAVPWRSQCEAGIAADSWRPAEIVRSSGADGMIYTARSAPERWHLVLFRWNELGGPSVSILGACASVADDC